MRWELGVCGQPARSQPLSDCLLRAATGLGLSRHHFHPHKRQCDSSALKPPGLTTEVGHSRRCLFQAFVGYENLVRQVPGKAVAILVR